MLLSSGFKFESRNSMSKCPFFLVCFWKKFFSSILTLYRKDFFLACILTVRWCFDVYMFDLIISISYNIYMCSYTYIHTLYAHTYIDIHVDTYMCFWSLGFFNCISYHYKYQFRSFCGLLCIF